MLMLKHVEHHGGEGDLDNTCTGTTCNIDVSGTSQQPLPLIGKMSRQPAYVYDHLSRSAFLEI